MADIKTSCCDGCNDSACDCERGKRGKRGKRGHDGSTGPTGPTGPGLDDSPPFPPQTILNTLYVRLVGIDSNNPLIADGTLALPYRTVQFAVTKVPLHISANVRWIVDCSGIGIEVFPPGYCLPMIMGVGVQDQNIPFAVDNYYRFRGAFSIRATPQAFSGIPLADTNIALADIFSITANANTGLYTIQLNATRASWAANSCRGTIFHDFGQVTQPGQTDGIIVDSTDDNGFGRAQLFITLTSQQPGNAVGTITPIGPYQIMEQSATFEGSTNASLGGNTAFNFFNLNSFSVGGIKFVDTAGPAIQAVAVRAHSSIWAFQLCDMSRPVIQGGGMFNGTLDTCYLHGGALSLFAAEMGMRKVYIRGATAYETLPQVGMFWMQGCVIDASAPFGKNTAIGGLAAPPQRFTVQAGGGVPVFMTHSLVRNGTAEGINAYGGGTYQFTESSGNVGAGIIADRPCAPARLTRFVGTLNGGIGCVLTNGANVDRNALTTVTGAGGDYKVGNNVVGVWGALVNENDLAGGAASQLCRITTSP